LQFSPGVLQKHIIIIYPIRRMLLKLNHINNPKLNESNFYLHIVNESKYLLFLPLLY
jgi:hypothetical protein